MRSSVKHDRLYQNEENIWKWLEDRTEGMANEAEGSRDLSHQLLKKYKDTKWYQF